MTVGTFLTSRVLIKLRKRFFPKALGDVLSDSEADRMFVAEIVNQLNAIANLTLVIYWMHTLDAATGPTILATPAIKLGTLLWVSGGFYLFALIVFYATTSSDSADN